MEIPAKVDYAVRAMAELAIAEPDRAVKAELVAEAQGIPAHFLKGILRELRLGGLVVTQRGHEGGYRLARPAAEITIADIVRAVHGPLATVRGLRPESLDYEGPAERLVDIWVIFRASMRDVLENITLDAMMRDALPKRLVNMGSRPDAWLSGKAR